MEISLQRFLNAQERDYSTALSEIRAGEKRSHWMWYIFPQISGLGRSATAAHYAINSIHEAASFLEHPLLGSRLIEITSALLQLNANNAAEIFGSPDDRKLHSCMTLFSAVPGAGPVFQLVLEKFFAGKKDDNTMNRLG